MCRRAQRKSKSVRRKTVEMIMKWTRAWLQSLNLDHHTAMLVSSEDIVIFWPELKRDIFQETMLSIQATSTRVLLGVRCLHSILCLGSSQPLYCHLLPIQFALYCWTYLAHKPNVSSTAWISNELLELQHELLMAQSGGREVALWNVKVKEDLTRILDKLSRRQ